MAVNSKLFHKFFIAILLILGCGNVKDLLLPHKCQVVVVLDKTNSVSYINKLPRLQQVFARNFELTYAFMEKNIQCSHLIITGNTQVFPDVDPFSKDCPYAEEQNRTTEAAIQRWKTEKRKWISDEIRQIISLIESPCNSNTTDIFSIFSGIQEVQKNNGPWDTINVFVFSDMINTSKPINMLKDIYCYRCAGKRENCL